MLMTQLNTSPVHVCLQCKYKAQPFPPYHVNAVGKLVTNTYIEDFQMFLLNMAFISGVK